MRTSTRAGFTLVELMVAMALTLFIMVILSQAFVISLETFAAMKGIGDMQETLRSAKVILTDDLAHDHFEGNRRLSDLTSTGGSAIVAERPAAGFFAIRHGSTVVNATAAAPNPGNYVYEGNDASGMQSFRAVDQILYMTVKRKGNRTDNFFTAAMPNTSVATNNSLTSFFSFQTSYLTTSDDLHSATHTQPFANGLNGFFSSQWAEVIYYLVRTGSTEEPNNIGSNIGTPTYSLFRAQYVMVADGTNVSNKASISPTTNLENTLYYGLSCNPGTSGALDFYSPADAATYVASPAAGTPQVKRMFPNLTTFNNGAVRSTTLVMPNVTSFHIQVMAHNGTAFGDVTGNVPAGATGGLFDTTRIGTGAPYTNNYGLKAIQVTLRVFEPKTRQTRQMTIVHDF